MAKPTAPPPQGSFSNDVNLAQIEQDAILASGPSSRTFHLWPLYQLHNGNQRDIHLTATHPYSLAKSAIPAIVCGCFAKPVFNSDVWVVGTCGHSALGIVTCSSVEIFFHNSQRLLAEVPSPTCIVFCGHIR